MGFQITFEVSQFGEQSGQQALQIHFITVPVLKKIRINVPPYF